MRGTHVTIQHRGRLSDEFADMGDDTVNYAAVAIGKLTDHVKGLFRQNHFDAGAYPILKALIEDGHIIGIVSCDSFLESDLKGIPVQFIQLPFDAVAVPHHSLPAWPYPVKNRRVGVRGICQI